MKVVIFAKEPAIRGCQRLDDLSHCLIETYLLLIIGSVPTNLGRRTRADAGSRHQVVSEAAGTDGEAIREAVTRPTVRVRKNEEQESVSIHRAPKAARASEVNTLRAYRAKFRLRQDAHCCH